MNISEFKKCLNDWGKHHIPFFFLIDFEMAKPIAWQLSIVDATRVWYNFSGVSNRTKTLVSDRPVKIEAAPETFEQYKQRFDIVMRKLELGGSFLTNLTIRTPVTLSHSLEEMYDSSQARYKILLKDQFLVFSPETFVRIQDGMIYTYPMKGTIDAAVPHAEETILSDLKERSEHVTVVDLLRNDLSIVATDVEVTRFRYVDRIKTTRKSLLQVSSEIRGRVMDKFRDRLGELVVHLLPAGSVSGAPKDETVKVIRTAEGVERGYYTGVCGLFDGNLLDTAVMIRFIEQQGNQFFFRSGGGITTQSSAEHEFQEAIDKIYVPVY
jgi:para-aminobenzoate synthetase component I